MEVGRLNILSSFKDLTKFEWCLWISSIVIVTASFLLSGRGDYLTLITSLIGVTSLIFVSKGYALGQLILIIFSILYGIISYYYTYYGEMITYMGMTGPIAALALISWIRNPFRGTRTVTVSRVSRRQMTILILLTIAVTVIFYFILAALGNANLIISTISITTSFLAASLTVLRSAAYAAFYASNDVVLIILWVLASMETISYFPMVVCFTMFLVNDLYGFYNWSRLRKEQAQVTESDNKTGL